MGSQNNAHSSPQVLDQRPGCGIANRKDTVPGGEILLLGVVVDFGYRVPMNERNQEMGGFFEHRFDPQKHRKTEIGKKEP